MKKALRVLLIEDAELDAELLVRFLWSSGYDVHSRRVCTELELDRALDDQTWDVVLCDYQLPGYDAIGAIELIRERGFDLPFLIVSGAIGEECAVQSMRSGAHDYVMKGNLPRLAPAIERELKEAEVRRERKRILERNLHLAAIVESTDDAIFSKNLDGIILSWNAGAERLYGYTADEARGQSTNLLTPPIYRDEVPDILRRIKQGETVERFETVRVRKDGSLIDVSLTISPVRNTNGQIIAASTIARDITERKRVEDDRKRMIEQLNKALSQVRTLSGLLPICAACKRIRDGGGYWQQIEAFLRANSKAQFSHSICPECLVQLYPEYTPGK